MEQRITAPKGCKIDSVEHDDNSVVIMFSEDKPKFKKGDFLKSTGNDIMVIYKENQVEVGFFKSYFNNTLHDNYNWNLSFFRICTSEEKQEMLDYMHSNGKDWDEVNMKVVPYILKPKDKELVWAYDDRESCRRIAAFYDIKNNCCFCSDGTRNGYEYDHYEPFEEEYPQWAKEALNKLED